MADLLTRTDEELLGAFVGSQCEISFEELVRRHKGDMESYVAQRYLGNDWQMAEDVVQHTFLKLATEAEKFDLKRGNLKSYLHTLASNHAINTMDKQAVRFAVSTAITQLTKYAEEPIGYDLEDTIADQPLEAIITEELHGRLKDIIAELSPVKREAVELVFYQGLTHRAAAKHLGVPHPTFAKHMVSAMRIIRERLDAPADDDARSRAA